MRFFVLLFLIFTSSCTIYTGKRSDYHSTTLTQPTVIYTDSYKPWRFWTYRPYWWSYRPNYLGNVYYNNPNYNHLPKTTIKTNIYMDGTNIGIYGGKTNSGRTSGSGGKSGPSGGRRK